MTDHKDAVLETRQQAVRLAHKKVSADGEFEGYGSIFGNVDSYGDVVAPGAFANSLSEHKAEDTLPALLWQHDPHQPIGVFTEMREDDRGLFVRGQLVLETQRGKEAHVLLKTGAINGLSIGYKPKAWQYDEDAEVLTLLEVDLWEVSVVTFPANQLAQVSGVKAKDQVSSLADWKSYERHLRDAGGYSKDVAAAMVAAAKRIRDDERDVRAALDAMQASSARLQNLLTS